MSKDDLRTIWADKASKALVGRTVLYVRYMTEKECEHFGWEAASLIIEFTDGSWLIPSRDDEGNDAGALFTGHEHLPTIPVI